MKKIYLFLSCCLVFAAMTFLSMGKISAQCNPIEVTQNEGFLEDFSSTQAIDSLNGEGYMPTCWNRIYNGSTAGYDPKVYNGTDAVVSGNNCIAISVGQSVSMASLMNFSVTNAGVSNYVILPKLANDLAGLEMIFTSKMTSDTIGILEIGYFPDLASNIDSTDLSTFVVLATIPSSSIATEHNYQLGSLPGMENFTGNLVFRWSDTSSIDVGSLISNPFNIDYSSLGRYLSLPTCYIDNISIRIVHSCAEPTNVTVSNITDATAQIGWTAGSPDQDLWEISYNDSTITVNTNPYTLTNLALNVEYTVNVRAICGDETSYWAAQSVTFSTSFCPSITVTDEIPYSEDFSGYQAVDSMGATGIVPDCWEKIYTGSTAGYDPKVYNGTGSVTPNDNCLAISAGVTGYSLFGYTIPLYNTGATNYVILPTVTNALDELQLMFTSKMSTDTAGTLEFGYFTDLSSTSNFVILTTITSTTVATAQMVNLNGFQATHGLHARLAFCWRDNRTSGASNCYIDDITLRIARDCAEPTDITVEHISDVSAVVSWTAASPSQTQWEISLNDSIITNVTTNPYTLTGLTAETEYVVNVRAVCTDENSYWAAQSVTFTTACPAIVVTDEEPFREGFEGADLGCWAADIVSGEDNWTLDYGAFHTGNKGVAFTSSVFGDLTNMGDDITAIMDMFGNMMNFGNGSARLTSPILDLTAVTGQVRLSFFRRQTTMMIPQTLYVYYRTSPSANWTLLQQYSATNDWTGEALTLPNPSATYQISFLSFCDIQSMGNIDPTAMMDPNAATNFASNIYLDDIRVGYAIVCNNPTDLTVSNVTTTSATVTWGGTADNWTLEYGPSGFTTGNGTTVTAQNPTYTFTGLTPGTSYDVHVRANCPENSFSDWVQTYFTTESEIGISENGRIALTIAPNPTTGTVRCTLSSTPSNTRLQVLDVYGKHLMEQEVTEQTTELDFSDKAAGLYFLRVVSDNRIVTTQKVIRR